MQGKKRIDDEIQHVLGVLEHLSPDSEEYGVVVNNLGHLCEARSKKSSRSVEMDTVIMAATNILGILLILQYEHVHVVASKALSFVAKRV